MALSGTLYSSEYNDYDTVGPRGVAFSWSATQNIAGNYSDITWSLDGYDGYDDIHQYNAGNFLVQIDGSTEYSSATRIKLYKGTHVASGTKRIYHASDGTASFSVHIEAAIYLFAVNCTGDQTFTLNTIGRTSNPTVNKSSMNFGETVRISTNRSATSLTHTLTYQIGTYTGTIASNVGAYYDWTPPLSLCSTMPNGVTGTCVITCTTYYGSTQIGTSTTSLTLNVPASVVPGGTITVDEAETEVKQKFNAYVKGLSRLDIDVNGAGIYGSSVVSVTLYANGATYTVDGSSLSVITEYLISSGTVYINATIKDSRGRSGSIQTSITALDYTRPWANTWSVFRSNSTSYVEDDESSVVALIWDLEITTLAGNSGTLKVYYKKHEDPDTSYTQISAITGSGTHVENRTHVSGINVDDSYDFKLEWADEYATTILIAYVSTAFTLVDYREDGHGIGFGKVAEGEYGFDVGLDTIFRGRFFADLSEILVVETFTYNTGVTIQANASQMVTISIEKTGYTPLGIVALNSASFAVIPWQYRLSNDGLNAYLYLRNLLSSSTTIGGVSVTILFIKEVRV